MVTATLRKPNTTPQAQTATANQGGGTYTPPPVTRPSLSGTHIAPRVKAPLPNLPPPDKNAVLPTTPTPAAGAAVDVEAQVVECQGESIKCTNTSAPQTDLTSIIPDPVASAAQSVEVQGEPVEVAQEAQQSQAVAERPQTQAVSVPRDVYHAEGVEGDWGSDDLKFPQLKLVQGSGPLSTQFDNGTIIYGDLELLPPPSVKADAKNPLIRFVPISLTKQFREKLTEDQIQAGEMPRVVNSIAEVEDLGGTTRWVGNSMPDNYWEPSARCMFLLELPEGSDHPGFVLELDGKVWAVAVYYAAGGAFRESARIIFNTALTSLLVPVLDDAGQPQKSERGQIVKKVMLWKNVWTLEFKKKQAGNFTPWRPIVKLLSKDLTGPDVRGYCEQLVSGTAEEAAAAGE